MKLQIHKGHIDILSNPKGTDVKMMNKVADRMVSDYDRVSIVAGDDDPAEAYVTLGYDSILYTVEDMKKMYSAAKKSVDFDRVKEAYNNH